MKFVWHGLPLQSSRRSPSWGAWIEMCGCKKPPRGLACRSPSWGAWIEIRPYVPTKAGFKVAPPRGERGLKSYCITGYVLRSSVAPPRGERGLKLVVDITKQSTATSRSPSRGAWIEIQSLSAVRNIPLPVAPPRGERGLKSTCKVSATRREPVAPPRGERGLKFLLSEKCFGPPLVAPLVGSVD